MKFEQAKALFDLIGEGQLIGCDTDDNPIHADSSLGVGLKVIGVHAYISRTGLNGLGTYRWDTKAAVLFLREWADALESQEPAK